MSSTPETIAAAQAPSDREKWESERLFRDREIQVKEREQDVKRGELELKRGESKGAGWRSPVVVAIFAAAVAAMGNATVTFLNSASQIRLEAVKSEQARILEMIKTGNPDKAAENLDFLLKAGLISDAELRTHLQSFLQARTPGSGPSLPTATPAKDASELLTKFGGAMLKPTKNFAGVMEIGSDHRLTEEELQSGKIVIDGVAVPFAEGITAEQAQRLANQDLEPIRKQIKAMVKQPLSRNQTDALASLAYNVGIAQVRRSSIPALIDAGKYDDVPAAMLKWSKVGGVAYPGLVQRRQAEIDLWNRK